MSKHWNDKTAVELLQYLDEVPMMPARPFAYQEAVMAIRDLALKAIHEGRASTLEIEAQKRRDDYEANKRASLAKPPKYPEIYYLDHPGSDRAFYVLSGGDLKGIFPLDAKVSIQRGASCSPLKKT